MAPAAGLAETARVEPSGGLTIVASPGETNIVTIDGRDGEILVRDTGAELRAGAGCRRRPHGDTLCAATPGLPIVLRLGDRDDVAWLRGSPASAQVDGGAGDDAIRAGNQGDVLDGGAGDDTLSGGSASDTIVGGAGVDYERGNDGDDELDGGAGDDELDGGAGTDRLTGGDGADRLAGGWGADVLEGDGGKDVLGGDDGDDQLDGGADGDTLFGGAGRDVVSGGDGVDALYGGADDDQLDGGDGQDGLYGADGADLLLGGAGGDMLDPGPGVDRVVAGEGNDNIYPVDGAADAIGCGPGDDDRVDIEAADAVDADCELVVPPPGRTAAVLAISYIVPAIKAKLCTIGEARRLMVRIEAVRDRETIDVTYLDRHHRPLGATQTIGSVPTGHWVAPGAARVPRGARSVKAVAVRSASGSPP
jgi:hypothetical protein